MLGQQVVGGGRAGRDGGHGRSQRAYSRSASFDMAKKGTKATRKFAASGLLTKKIQARRKHQQIQRKLNKNKNARSNGQERLHVDADNNKEEGSEKETKLSKKRYVILYHSVDDTLHIPPCCDLALKACR